MALVLHWGSAQVVGVGFGTDAHLIVLSCTSAVELLWIRAKFIKSFLVHAEWLVLLEKRRLTSVDHLGLGLKLAAILA